ncbi:MAG TPA: hypothetical protein VE442_24590 [Jatrophihabitans sp.]|jgi:hypothetical protein|nr:hypothetical protein [Jatrophihabitans sp.]
MGLAPLPASDAIQFVPAKGTFVVEKFVDPSGVPIDVVDIDDGFTVSGHVELPGWLSGKGVVRLAADQIGGPFDATIGQQTLPIPGSSSPTDPKVMKYPWSITVKSPTLPDRDEMYKLGVLFAFQTLAGGHTDIGGFYDLGSILVV